MAGPIALFDKSFVQSLNVDESVWFDHFFMTVISPMFYVETLADLAKECKPGRPSSDDIVKNISTKTPQLHSNPCAFHASLVIGNLLGNELPMNGRIPLVGGKPYRNGDKLGVSYKDAPEADAFNRWSKGNFYEVEKEFASKWREIVQNSNFEFSETELLSMGVPVKNVKTLEEIRKIVSDIVENVSMTGGIIQTVLKIFNSTQLIVPIIRRWQSLGGPPIKKFAPYASFFYEVEMFFLIAVNKGIISADRKSNKIDISYLYYLPFCMIFISTDKLHQRCAPFFLREDQEFIWGNNMKEALTKTNEYFLTFPVELREKGLSAIAPAPPVCFESEITRVYDIYCRKEWRRKLTAVTPPKGVKDRNIVEEVNRQLKLPEISQEEADQLGEPKGIIIERNVSQGRGHWYQVPKGIKKQENQQNHRPNGSAEETNAT